MIENVSSVDQSFKIFALQSDAMSAFFRRTPVVSSASDVGVVFKLECLQSSGSFKDRGIGHMIASLRERDDVARLVCSSGGNAGLAVATVAERLNLPATIFVPLTTLPLMITKIRARGATVIVGGANWNEADVEARKLVTSDADGRTLYVPPFDHELIFEGNSTIVDELVDEFGVDAMPDVIVCSVGGGGLLRGIQLGLARHKLESRVRIIAYVCCIYSFLYFSANCVRFQFDCSTILLAARHTWQVRNEWCCIVCGGQSGRTFRVH